MGASGQRSDWKVKVVTGRKEGIRGKAITDEGVVITRDGREETDEAENVLLALAKRVNELAEQPTGRVAEIQVIEYGKERCQALGAIHERARVASES